MSPIASKSYSLGEIIATSEPLVHVLSSQFKAIYCDNCFAKNQSLKKCSQCKQYYYCDRNCQQIDWKFHKFECHIYNRYDCSADQNNEEQQWLMVDNNSLWRILMRLWLLIQSDPSIPIKKYNCPNGQQRCLNDLITHTSDIKNDKPRMVWFSKICSKFVEFGVNICTEKLLTLLGQIAVNGYECKNYDQTNLTQYSNKFLGYGVYIPISIFNHSCQPNAAYINFGNKIQVRAIKPIAANEQISIDYIPLERSKSERRFILEKDWYFYCMCTKCESDFDHTIDYKTLRSLVESGDETIEHNFPSEHELSILKQIYNGFHPGYSFYLLMNLLEKVNDYYNNNSGHDSNHFQIDIKRRLNVKESILSTFENLTVTHGKEHELFEVFEKIVYKFGIHNID